MGEMFVEFRGGSGAWTQESRVVADTTSWGRLFHLATVGTITSSCTAYIGREGYTQCHGSS